MFVAELLFFLLLILVAAEVFTNALEHLGERLHISEGVTGSVFAAVGTALPETLVPLLAIFGGTANQALNEEIGVGAILGAPLMLSTLSLFLMSVAVLKRRGIQGHLTPERTGLKRDLDFFLMAFLLAFVAMFVPHGEGWVRGALAFVMVLIYFVYVMLTLRASAKLVEEGHATEAGSPMLLTRVALTVARAAGTALLAQEGAFGTLLLEKDVCAPPLMFGDGGRLRFESAGPGWGLACEPAVDWLRA